MCFVRIPDRISAHLRLAKVPSLLTSSKKQVSDLYVTTRVINKCIPKQDGESKAMFG